MQHKNNDLECLHAKYRKYILLMVCLNSISVVQWTASLWTNFAFWRKRPRPPPNIATRKTGGLSLPRPLLTSLTPSSKWVIALLPAEHLLPVTINSIKENLFGRYIDRLQKWSANKKVSLKIIFSGAEKLSKRVIASLSAEHLLPVTVNSTNLSIYFRNGVSIKRQIYRLFASRLHLAWLLIFSATD